MPAHTVTLSVTASDATSYQWYFADVPVAGGNANTLVISNFLAGAVGNYYVKVSNAVGAVQSKIVAIELAKPGSNGGHADQSAWWTSLATRWT